MIGFIGITDMSTPIVALNLFVVYVASLFPIAYLYKNYLFDYLCQRIMLPDYFFNPESIHYRKDREIEVVFFESIIWPIGLPINIVILIVCMLKKMIEASVFND